MTDSSNKDLNLKKPKTVSNHVGEPMADNVNAELERYQRVNHPEHYKWLPNGLGVIDITENLNFNRGNAVKYIMRAHLKGCELEDLEKAAWYIEREIGRMKRNEL